MGFFSWDKIESKQKVSLIVLGIIVTTWLFYSFLLLPQWTCIDKLTAQYNLEDKQIKVVGNFAVSHPSPEQYMIELDNKLIQVDRMLPDNPDISSFLIDMGKLSKRCGIQLISIKPAKVVTKEGYREYDLELLIKGDFMRSMDFFNKIENGLRFTNITNAGMQGSKEGLESKLLVKIYSYGVPATTNSKTTGTKK